MPPVSRRWLSFTSTPSSRPKRCSGAAGRDGVLLEGAQAGRRLARVEDGGAGARDRVDVAARERGDPGKPADEVECQPLAREHAARGAVQLGNRAPVDRGSFPDHRLEADAELGEDRPRGFQAADDSRLLREHNGRARRVLVDERERRDISGADVLGQPGGRVGERQCHRSNGHLVRADDAVYDETLVLEREVGAEMAAAALLACERAARDQPGQEMRRLGETAQAGPVAHEPGVLPHRRAELRRNLGDTLSDCPWDCPPDMSCFRRR